MDKKQTRVVLLWVIAAAVGWLGAPLLGRRPAPMMPPAAVSLDFDGERALESARAYVTRHPTRVLGSIESRQSTGFLKDQLAILGYDVQYQHFEALVAGRTQVGRNVFALKRGQLAETIVVVAHYDTAGTTVQGAADNGIGVAAMLELARVFADETPRRSILFVACDGEEWGMLGTQDFAQSYAGRKDIAAAVSLDGFCPGLMTHFRLHTAGLMNGYSPPWLRRLAGDAARQEGLPVAEPSGVKELIDRAFLISNSDHGPFLAAGIPAITLGGEAADRAEAWKVIHTAGDTIDRLDPPSIEKYGRAAERLVRALAGLPALPKESMSQFQVISGRFFPPSAVFCLHLLCFLPFLAAFRFQWKGHADDLSVELVQRELPAFLGAWIPFLAGYGGIVLLTRLGYLPQYSLFPPPPGDPIAETPSWGAMGAIVLLGIIAAAILFFLGKFLARKLPQSAFAPAKLFVLILFLGVLLLALIYNSCWAVTFLALPSVIWSLVRGGTTAGGRAANRILIVAAAIPYFAITLSYVLAMGLGWKALWFQTLALSAGLFTLSGFCLATAAIAVGIRLLALQSR